MPFPNFTGKHAHDPVFTPLDFLAYVKRGGRLAAVDVPPSMIFCYRNSLLQDVLANDAVEPVPLFWSREIYRLTDTGGRVGVSHIGIGAPAAATALEEHIALGARRFIRIGTAGGLQRRCRIGDLVVCTKAVRDEGLSHHFLAPAEYAEPSADLTAALTRQLDEIDAPYAAGPSWTIDAPFRETIAEVRHYQARGVLTVEMEAAALFAVAQVRGVEVAAAFAVSDSLAGLVWDPRFGAEETWAGLLTLYRVARATLAAP